MGIFVINTDTILMYCTKYMYMCKTLNKVYTDQKGI